jgi:hypothetical protein
LKLQRAECSSKSVSGRRYGVYSPECVEGVFYELGLPLYGFLRSSC